MNNNLSPAFKIVVVYVFLCILSMIFVDYLIHKHIKDFNTHDFLKILGLIFVGFSAILIYFLVNKYINKEKKLRQTMENYFNYSGIPTVVFNDKGESLYMNNAWIKTIGYEEKDMNTFEKFAKLAFRDKADEIMKYFESKLYADNRVNLGEYEVYAKDGRVLIWNFFHSLFEIRENEKIFIGISIDLTELRNKEALLIQQSKMATMGEMIGNIAHQWKQPLNIISISNSLLKLSKDDKSLFEDIDNITTNIDNSVKNLSSTIDDFRNFFNPNKSVKIFNTNLAFDKTLKLIKSQFVANEIQIVRNIEDIEVEGYENELLQVLINIIKNAKDQLIKINPKIKVLILDVKSEDSFVIIKIKDSANGIPNEYKNRIFDNYFTTKESEGGTGIGLSMSKQIIEQSMQGSIKAYNEEFIYKNENCYGAVFEIKIPKNIHNSAL